MKILDDSRGMGIRIRTYRSYLVVKVNWTSLNGTLDREVARSASSLVAVRVFDCLAVMSSFWLQLASLAWPFWMESHGVGAFQLRPPMEVLLHQRVHPPFVRAGLLLIVMSFLWMQVVWEPLLALFWTQLSVELELPQRVHHRLILQVGPVSTGRWAAEGKTLDKFEIIQLLYFISVLNYNNLR